jgi:ribosomal protein S18 acetylase RimI-like enzyme
MPEIRVALSVRELRKADLATCGWSGDALHVAGLARTLDRVAGGGVDYLAVCPPSDVPVAIGGVDYEAAAGAGTLWQLCVHPALQSCGIGTVLITAAEQRIAARGLRTAELSVEESNPRARALYERLGYLAAGRRAEAWDMAAADGSVARYETMCVLMRKALR